MKNYRELTPKYIKNQLKYTLSIATSIIIATILIVCMLVLSKSSSRNAIERAEYVGGKHHVALMNVSKSEVHKLRNNKLVKNVYTKALMGIGTMKSGKSILIGALDSNCLKAFDYTLAAGRFPHEGKLEIVIEKWMLDNLRVKHKLGQQLKFEITNKVIDNTGVVRTYARTASFKLVGILNDNHYSKLGERQGDNWALTSMGTVKSFPYGNFIKYTAFVKFKRYSHIPDKAVILQKDINDKNVLIKLNESLVDEYLNHEEDAGGDTPWEMSISNFVSNNIPIIIAVFMIIYNIFNLSVMNRRKDFGILRCLGAKPSQIRELILGEALYITLFSLPVGFLVGIGISKGLVVLSSKAMNVTLAAGTGIYIPWDSMMLGITMVLAAILLAAIIPAISAGSVAPLVIVNKDTGYIDNSKLTTGKFYDFLLNKVEITFIVAIQNIWRNKKRFIFTILCMCISGAIFMQQCNNDKMWGTADKKYEKAESFNDPFKIIQAPYNMEADSLGVTIKDGYSEKDYLDIKRTKGVKSVVAKMQDLTTYAADNKIIFTNDAKKNYVIKACYFGSNVGTPITGLDNVELRKCRNFITEGKIDIEKMKKEPIVILVNRHRDVEHHRDINITNCKVGDIINIKIHYKNGAKYAYKLQKLRVGGILNGKFANTCIAGGWGLDIIMHKNMFKKLTHSNLYQDIAIFSNNKTATKSTGLHLKEISMRVYAGRFSDRAEEFKMIDVSDKQGEMIKNGILLSLILIGIINIFNTMATNLNTRALELGLLRIVGLTRRQLRNMIALEASLYGIISFILAFVGAMILSYKDFLSNISYPYLTFQISWKYVLIVLIANILVSLAATVVPLKKITKKSPIESVKVVE